MSFAFKYNVNIKYTLSVMEIQYITLPNTRVAITYSRCEQYNT